MQQSFDQFGYACYSGAFERTFVPVRYNVSRSTFTGKTDGLQLLIPEGDRPDLTRRQEPMGYTYATLLVLGYIGRVGRDNCTENDYINMLDLLLTSGVPVDSRDIIGRTALHHAANWSGNCGLAKILLKHKADVNLQDRFGASPLLGAIGQHIVDIIPVLLDADANLDITDGEGSSPRSMYPTRPIEVSNTVNDWLVKHEGKGSVLQGDRCSKCGTRSTSMKRCTRCRSQLYCSPECQSEFVRVNTTLSHTTHDKPLNQRGGLERTQKAMSTL